MQNNPQPHDANDANKQLDFNNDMPTVPVPPPPDTPTVLAPPPPDMPGTFFQQEATPQDTLPAGTSTAPAPPPPQKKMSNTKMLIGAGALLLVLAVLGFVGAAIFLKPAPPTTGQSSTSTGSVATTTPARTNNIYAPYLTQYRSEVRDQIAQGLHLSSDQLETQLNSGKTLSTIATAQNISATQLQTIVTNAFQTGFQPAVNSGNLTQKQIDTLAKRMLKQPKTLDRYLTIRTRTKKNNNAANATPIAQ